MKTADVREIVMQALRLYPPTEPKYAAVVSDLGDDLADRLGYDSAAQTAREIIRSGQPLPPPLDQFVLDVLDGKVKRKQRGPNRERNRYRDMAISYAIYQAVSAGLNPYRNNATTENSACDLVAECLREFGIHLSYKAIAKICASTPTVPSE